MRRNSLFPIIFLLFIIGLGLTVGVPRVQAYSCWVCTPESGCQPPTPDDPNYTCGPQTQNCRNVGCTAPNGIPGNCYYTAQIHNCISGGPTGCTTQGGKPASGSCYIAPPPTSGPPPPPGGGACGWCASNPQCSNAGGTAVPNSSCSNGFCCTGAGGGGGGGGPPVDPCPRDTCDGYCCNYACVTQPCFSNYDCVNPAAQCLWGSNPSGLYCRNPVCPNNTIPGGICGCSGGIACGAPCAGGCNPGSTCVFTDYNLAVNDSCGGGTYCVGANGVKQTLPSWPKNYTFNSSYDSAACNRFTTATNYFLERIDPNTGAVLQTSGFTPAQIQSTCQQGTIQARAKIISPADITCAAIQNSTAYLTGTSFALSPSVAPASQTQSGSSYVSWTSSVPAGTYTLLATPPAGYVLQNSCWTRSATAPTSGSGTAVAVNTTDTAIFDLGYTLGTPWVQTQGGDVIIKDTIKSLMTTLSSPRLFSINGSGGYPGGVFYGSTGASPYNFNADPSDPTFGANYTSSTNWLANEPGDGGSKDPFKIDWYQYFLYQFDLSAATPDYTNPPTPIGKPASRTIPYYVQGDMTTSGDWTVGTGENIIFVVTGNVTIKGKINITGTGFVAFIAKGNISVDPTVGVPFSSSAPVVEGFYITSPTGSFITGQSTNAGTERFVGKGSFIAGNFLLQRDLSGVGHNADISAELFVHNPQLLLTMPEKMKEVKVRWSEVAP